jgi:hypothetical protein
MTSITLLAHYLLAAMVSWAPPEVHAYTGVSKADTLERYEAIANDMAVIASQEAPLFAGNSGRAKGALLAMAIASYESGRFRADVDTTIPSGDCQDKRGHALHTKNCEGGTRHAVCLAQIWLRHGETLKDRQDCFRLEFDRIRESMHACSRAPADEKLAVYASGNCQDGLSESRTRVRRAMRYWQTHEFLTGFDSEDRQAALTN